MLAGESESGATGIAEAGMAAKPDSATADAKNIFRMKSPLELPEFQDYHAPFEHAVNDANAARAAGRPAGVGMSRRRASSSACFGQDNRVVSQLNRVFGRVFVCVGVLLEGPCAVFHHSPD